MLFGILSAEETTRLSPSSDGIPLNLFLREGMYFLITSRNEGGISPITFSAVLLNLDLKKFLIVKPITIMATSPHAQYPRWKRTR